MNYYLIWTDEGWLKIPIYTHLICSGCGNLHLLNGIDFAISTTSDIRYAFRLNKEQAEECLTYLQRYGVASWAIEVKEDMLQDVLKELKQKAKGETK